MRSTVLAVLLTVVLVAAAPSASSASGGPFFRRSHSVSYYYCPPYATTAAWRPVTVYRPAVFGVYHAVDPCPPVTYSRRLSPQTPAPPSQPSAANPEPINSYPKTPKVTESRASLYYSGQVPPKYDTYYAAPNASIAGNASDPETCTISFWNLTGGQTSLQVNGQSHTLATGQQLKLSLPRQVSWRLAGHEPVNITVSQQEQGIEIVIRR